MVLLSGCAHPDLAVRLRATLGMVAGPPSCGRYPDGEICVDIGESLVGRDVFIVQPLASPAGEHLLEMLLLSDASRRAGARRLMGICPYLGYARQDRRPKIGMAVGAGLVLRQLCQAFDLLVLVDPHSPSLEAVCSIPITQVSAIPFLAKSVIERGASPTLVVAPDQGAMRRAAMLAELLGVPSTVVIKERLGPTRVKAGSPPREVRGQRVLLVDDMLSTGGTIEAAVETLAGAGALLPMDLVFTHGVFAEGAGKRLAGLPLGQIHFTDTLPVPADHELIGSEVSIVSVVPLLAEVMRQPFGRETSESEALVET